MHDHSHRHGDSNARIGLAFALNLSFTIIEFIGSLLTNSTAIKADAAHDWTSHDLVDTLPPFESLWAQPTVPDECDACVQRLTERLEAEGLQRAHLVREDHTARLCVHYDPQHLSVTQVRSLVQTAGARIANRYHHKNLRIDGMDCPVCTTVIEHALGRMDGVLEAAVSYGAERLRLEFDTETTTLVVRG